MSVKTIYKCDKCHKEWNADSKDEQICTVGISVAFGRTSIEYKSSAKQQQWCRTCVMKTGIHPPVVSEDKEDAPEKESTFEEKVILLLEHLGVQFD